MDDKELQRRLQMQDYQIAAVHQAEEVYKDDLKALTAFWEGVWSTGGLKFRGAKWNFRLPDLYIKQKRYQHALNIVRLISDDYKDKKVRYIEQLEKKLK